ncbi:MAG: AI-2E family transporter [Aquaticitalea sp.]
MNSKTIAKGNLKTLAVVAGVVLLIYILYKIQSLLLFVFIAFVISLICRPLVSFFKNRLKFGNTLASTATLVVVGLFLFFMLRIFLPIVLAQSKNISEIDFNVVKKDLNELNIQASEYLGVDKINIVEAVKRTDFVKNFNSEFISKFVEVFFQNIGDVVIGLFSVLFISFFLLKDEHLITNAVTSFADKGNERRSLVVMMKIKELLSRYFLGLLIQTLIVAVLYFGLMLYVKVENPMAIAIICAFLNIVPYLGPLIGGVLMLLIVVSNNLGANFSTELLPLLLKVMAGVAIVQLIDNLINQPVIFGRSVRSHPLEIFIAIVVGGLLFNIGGMILAVPVYTTIKVISKEFLSEYKIVKHLTKNL